MATAYQNARLKLSATQSLCQYARSTYHRANCLVNQGCCVFIITKIEPLTNVPSEVMCINYWSTDLYHSLFQERQRIQEQYPNSTLKDEEELRDLKSQIMKISQKISSKKKQFNQSQNEINDIT